MGPPGLDPPDALPHGQFVLAYAEALRDGENGRDRQVQAFKDLQDAARASAGIASDRDPADREIYEQYREWLPFDHRNQVILSRIADALGYDLI